MKTGDVLTAAQHIRLLKWAETVQRSGRPIALSCPGGTGIARNEVELQDWLTTKVLGLLVKEANAALDGYGITRD